MKTIANAAPRISAAAAARCPRSGLASRLDLVRLRRRRQRADATGLQGAGLRVPVRRQRRQQHGHSDRHRRLRPVRRRAPGGIRHQPRAGIAAADPAGQSRHRRSGCIPRSPSCRRCSTRTSMAILANVGTLLQPTTQAQYTAGLRPLSLYSHADQQAQWQSAISSTAVGHRLGRPHRRQGRAVQRGDRAFRSSPRSTAPCCSPPARRPFR